MLYNTIVLVKKMDLSDEFIMKNKDSIKHFLLKNGSELAHAYYNNCREKDQQSYKKIVKSELMGQFKKLKYYTNDLIREIDYKLNDLQINEWTNNNRSILDGAIEVKEYDDFYNIMVLGEKPQSTCLSYKDGIYNYCLLSCFDSNKKVLYAKINSKIVGRAMIRLTKGKFDAGNNKLDFVDLENIKSESNIKCQEYLTLFLERPYISGVTYAEETAIKKMFIKILEDKAIKMNAKLVLSNQYSSVHNANYISTRYYMYISKSKAGAQYLDSLNGRNDISDEGHYKSSTFIVFNEKADTVIDEIAA